MWQKCLHMKTLKVKFLHRNNTLHDALSSPYNTYAFAKKDTFNYLNVVSKIICETIARKTLVSPDAYPDLEDLFRMISDEDK